ncbi:MAG: hypothetical protein ACRENI_07270 [Gemmatimonadaceae bacterium]
MSWSPFDCHAHTTNSDGACTVVELIQRVRSRGVRPSVSDHVSGDVPSGLRSARDFERYLDELELHDVGRAAEFCWHDPLWRELPPALMRRLTHRIGSLHAILLPGGQVVHAFAESIPDGLSPSRYMDAHIVNLERLVIEMPVDILAHPTLVPFPLRKLPLEELWTEELEERAVAALAGAGICFEISSRYWPHERFVRRAVDGGVRISLGSDGHAADSVGDVARPLALARFMGVPDEEIYDPTVHGSCGLTRRVAYRSA